MQEINAVGAGETPPGEQLEFVRGKMARLFDNWNADHGASYAQVFTEYTLTPNLAPHTIGPTGTFVVAQRPVSLDGANLILNTSSPNINIQINLRDEGWWLNQAVPDLTSSIPTDLYYAPKWPNGELNFWPVPKTAYGVQLETRTLLTALGLDTTFSLPPGYQDAITLTLAESICSAFEKATPSPTLAIDAAKARARIFGNNSISHRIQTQDAGMPERIGPRSNFNWVSGQLTR